MESQPSKAISKNYIAWLSAAVFFLSVAFFLFLEDLAKQGVDLFGTLGVSALFGMAAILFLTSGGFFYKSFTVDALKKKYSWLNTAFVITGLGITFLLEAFTRMPMNILDYQWAIKPTDLTIPLLLISAVCVFMAKKYSQIS